jgi:hypothetical protein
MPGGGGGAPGGGGGGGGAGSKAGAGGISTRTGDFGRLPNVPSHQHTMSHGKFTNTVIET